MFAIVGGVFASETHSEMDNHFNSGGETSSTSGRWSLFFLVNSVIAAAVLYKKKDDIISAYVNRHVQVRANSSCIIRFHVNFNSSFIFP